MEYLQVLRSLRSGRLLTNLSIGYVQGRGHVTETGDMYQVAGNRWQVDRWQVTWQGTRQITGDGLTGNSLIGDV